METKDRIKIAEEINNIIGGNVWSKGDSVRNYINKGFAIIDQDGGINIDPIKRANFETVRDALKAAGYNPYRG